MRILTVTHFFESHGGGIERVAGHLCRNLAVLGHDCEWAASAADPLPVDDAIRILPLECYNPTERLTGLPMPIPGPAALRDLARAIDRSDVVIIHDALYCTSIAAMTIARSKGRPIILFQHIAAIAFASRLMRTLMRTANRLVTRPMLFAADQVIFISETVHEAFVSVRMKRSPRVLFNGVDRSIFHPGPSDRKSLGLPEAGLVAAFAGRFVEKKGLVILRELATRRPDITFALVGSGPVKPGRWGLPNIRVFGPLNPPRVGDVFRAADILLLPSVGEGYPLVIQEAMACGVPVICGAESARADSAAGRWLKGVDVDLARPQETAVSMSRLLDKPSLSTEQKQSMAAYAAKTYIWPRAAQSLAEIAADLAT